MKPISRAEWALFAIPIVFVPLALAARNWKIANAPKPTPFPTVAPTPKPNLYNNFFSANGAILPSPDGRLIHTTHSERTNKFQTWKAHNGELVRRFGNFRYGNTEAVLSPDGRILGFEYGGAKSDRVTLLDSATGREKLQLPNLKRTGYGFDVNNEVVALPTNDDILLFSVSNGKIVGKLRHRPRDFYPKRPRFSGDGQKILWIGFSNRDFDSYANGNSSDEIVWFDWKQRRLINRIEFPQTDLFQARFSGDGRTILASGFRRYWMKSRRFRSEVNAQPRLFAVDVQTGKQLYTKPILRWPNDIAVSPDGKWFFFPANDGQFQSDENFAVFEVKTGRRVQIIKGWSLQAAWSADSKTLYLSGGSVSRWKLRADGKWHPRSERSTP